MKKWLVLITMTIAFGYSISGYSAPSNDLPIVYPEDVLTIKAEKEVFGLDPDSQKFGQDDIEQKRRPSFVRMKKEEKEKMYLRFYPFYDLTRAKN